MLTLDHIVNEISPIPTRHPDFDMYTSIACAVLNGSITERQFKALVYVIRKNRDLFEKKFGAEPLRDFLANPTTRATIRKSANYTNQIRYLGGGMFGLTRQTNYEHYQDVQQMVSQVRGYRYGDVTCISATEVMSHLEYWLAHFNPDLPTLDFIEMASADRAALNLDVVGDKIIATPVGPTQSSIRAFLNDSFRVVDNEFGFFEIPLSGRNARRLTSMARNWAVTTPEFDAALALDPYPEGMSVLARHILDYDYRVFFTSKTVTVRDVAIATREATEFDGLDVPIHAFPKKGLPLGSPDIAVGWWDKSLQRVVLLNSGHGMLGSYDVAVEI